MRQLSTKDQNDTDIKTPVSFLRKVVTLNTTQGAFLTVKSSDESEFAPRNPNSTIVWNNSENN